MKWGVYMQVLASDLVRCTPDRGRVPSGGTLDMELTLSCMEPQSVNTQVCRSVCLGPPAASPSQSACKCRHGVCFKHCMLQTCSRNIPAQPAAASSRMQEHRYICCICVMLLWTCASGPKERRRTSVNKSGDCVYVCVCLCVVCVCVCVCLAIRGPVHFVT